MAAAGIIKSFASHPTEEGCNATATVLAASRWLDAAAARAGLNL